MSIPITPQTIELGFKLARLGALFLASRGQKVDESLTVDTVDEAIAQFESLKADKPYDPFKGERTIDVKALPVGDDDTTGEPI